MKIFRLILALVLPVVGMSASAAVITSTGTKPAVGNGNSGSPYEIRTAEELRWFVHYENTRHWFPNDHAKLMCDIDLSTICGPDKGTWIPLGCAEEDGASGYYYGNFDGNGYTVSGMYQDGDDLWEEPYSPGGFFGTLGGAHVNDLTVEGIIIRPGKVSGGLAGAVHNESMRYNKIVNCESKVHFYLGNILGAGEEEPAYESGSQGTIGGLVGEWTEDNSENLENCVFSGEFHFTRSISINVGGLIGFAKGRVIQFHFYNCCAVTGRDFPMIGYTKVYKCKFNNCISDGAILGYVDFPPDCAPIFTGNIYGSSKGIFEKQVGTGIEYIEPGIDNNMSSTGDIARGIVCYQMNQIMGGQYFTQTLGVDKLPYPNSAHRTVYRVKRYTQCGSDDYEWTYSNSSEDITDKREHVFKDGHATCTVCGEGVNPDYGIATDAEGYYLAATAEDVKWVWNVVNVSGLTAAKVRLTADIDMGNEAMAPLAEFSGIFDGQGHRLDNINICCTGVDKVALVGSLRGTIKDLTISGTVEATYGRFIAGAAAYVWDGGEVSGVRNDCTVKATGAMGGSITMYIGGVVGYADGTVKACVNNGAVVDASTCTGTLKRYIAGVVGLAYSSNTLSLLANTGVVGATGGTVPTAGKASAVANCQNSYGISSAYYATGISNPGLKQFYSMTANDGDTSVGLVDVGSGRLAWLLGGKDYDSEDGVTRFFGQTIGTDMVPYPYVSAAHQGVYNKKRYYNCSDYADYSNSPVDGVPLGHTFDAKTHYCTVCYTIDENYVPKDPVTKVYLISTEEQFNIFAATLNEAKNWPTPMKYASASIQQDLDFRSKDYEEIHLLYGHIHGNGHCINLGDKNKDIVYIMESDAVVEHLDVAFSNAATKHLTSYNHGRVTGCNITGGIPAHFSYGIVNNCSGENLDGFIVEGRYTNCLVKNYTDGVADYYRLYNSTVEPRNPATYTVVDLEQGPTGALAYKLNQSTSECVWGQRLGVDTSPRAVYGQTPESPTYVTRLITYSAANVLGNEEYYNAGDSLDATPGSYSVSAEPEAWASVPTANFIVDCGGDIYTAEAITLQPGVAHHMPMQLTCDRFGYSESFEADELVSLIFPVDMPVSNIAGKVYLFNGYKAAEGEIYFSAFRDFDYLPANTPVVILADGGPILKSDVADATVMPMTGGYSSVRESVEHSVSYIPFVLPGDVVTTDDDENIAYYMLQGTKAHAAAKAPRRAGSVITAVSALGIDDEGDRTVAPLEAYFAIPVESAATAPATLQIVLNENEPFVPTGIDDAELDRDDLYPCRVYNLRGEATGTANSRDDLRGLQPGIYILTSASASIKIAIRF